MYLRKLYFLVVVALITVSYTSQTYADLLISPLRVVLDERSRSGNVTLINSGNETRSYRVSWVQQIALPQGGYRNLTEEEQRNYAGLERMVRISPKQVTLAPKQRQTVKLLLRNPGNLPVGEYRSHLKFTALPTQDNTADSNNQTKLKLNLLMSYTMPVMYRKGTVRVAPNIDNLSLVTVQETGKTFIKVQLSHDDLYSTSGRLVAYWTAPGQARKQVGLINGYNFYPELRTAEVKVPWPSFKLEPGVLEVRYEGQQEFSNLLLAEQRLTITDEMIRSLR